MIFLFPIFLITDLYEFSTNTCLQYNTISISTKFCMVFNTKAQCALTCVVVLSPDSLIVKYFMTLCMFELFPFFNAVKPHKLVFKRKYLFKSEALS